MLLTLLLPAPVLPGVVLMHDWWAMVQDTGRRPSRDSRLPIACTNAAAASSHGSGTISVCCAASFGDLLLTSVIAPYMSNALMWWHNTCGCWLARSASPCTEGSPADTPR